MGSPLGPLPHHRWHCCCRCCRCWLHTVVLCRQGGGSPFQHRTKPAACLTILADLTSHQ